MLMITFDTTKQGKVTVRADHLLAVEFDKLTDSWTVWNTARFGWNVSEEDAKEIIQKMLDYTGIADE